MRLPVRYNFVVSWFARLVGANPFRKRWRLFPTREVLEALADPTVLHFIGRRKPWHFNTRPCRNVYRRAMAELGLLENGRLPGETPARKALGFFFFDAFYALMRWYARLLIPLTRSRTGD